MRPTGATVSLGPVLLVTFIGTMGFSIVLPFLVFLVTRFGGNAFVYGLVGATYPAFQFLGAPILGRWSDRYGRRRVLLLSQGGTLLSWLVFGVALFLPLREIATVRSSFAGDFTITLPLLVLFVSRAVDGITGGNISVANAYVADVSTDDDRNRNFGRMGVASNLGLVLGPALASVLGASAWGETLPVLAAILISLIATVVIATALPESRPCGVPWKSDAGRAAGAMGQEPRDCIHAAESPPAPRGAAFRVPGVSSLLTLYFVLYLAFNFYYAAFPLHAATNLEWRVVETGLFFAVLSSLMVIVQGPVLSRLSQRFAERTLVVVGSVVLGTNFLFMQSRETPMIYAGATLFAIGNGIMWPSVVSLLSKAAGDRLQGAVQGIAGSAGGLASILGLVLGGVAFSAIGVGTFVVSAALAYFAGVLALRLSSDRP